MFVSEAFRKSLLCVALFSLNFSLRLNFIFMGHKEKTCVLFHSQDLNRNKTVGNRKQPKSEDHLVFNGIMTPPLGKKK